MYPFGVIGAILVALAMLFGAERFGHSSGVNEQKVADQVEFDKVNADLANQKKEAAAMYQKDQADIISSQQALALLKNQLETDHAQSQAVNESLRRKYAGSGLRFTTTAKASGGGASSGSTQATAGSAPSPEATTIVQLPDKIAGNLQDLTFDADSWITEYKLCYAWAMKKVGALGALANPTLPPSLSR